MNSTRADLEQALHRLKLDRGDETAWGTVYDHLAPRARALAYRLAGGDAGLMDDAVQDALERLVRYADFSRLDGPEDLVRYFSTMVRHSVVDCLRKKGSARVLVGGRLLQGDEEEEEGADEVAQGPEEQLMLKRAMDSLYKALTPRERLVLTLLIGGYNRSEIAARLGVAIPTAAVLVHRLRKRIRALSPLD